MRITSLVVCLGWAVFVSGQALPAKGPGVPGPIVHGPIVGILDFYGLHKVSESKLRQALGAKEGDSLPHSKGDAEDRLAMVSGVVESHLEAVCCDHGRTILYVGIEERGAPHFELRDPPAGDVALSDEIMSTYRRLMEAAEKAIRRGSTQEDLTEGHSRMADPITRAIQDMLPELAREHLTELRNVLRNAADEDQRAIAVYVIAYAPKKSEVLNDVQYALKDSDPSVRHNAVKALTAFYVLATKRPDLNLKVEPTWFIEMLNSISWTDRNRALTALQTLTETADPVAIEQLRVRALPALIEMAKWKTLDHALPAYILLGRVAGLTDIQVHGAWSRGDRDFVINAVTKKKK